VRSDSLSKLGDINPKIPEAEMSHMKPIRYTSRDGLTIHGYLTLPLGREPRNLPCIVNPHGAARGTGTAGATTPRSSSSPTAATASCR
jgi:dipeptidyl aminopeptidase/acylaminoacyl peptidase